MLYTKYFHRSNYVGVLSQLLSTKSALNIFKNEQDIVVKFIYKRRGRASFLLSLLYRTQAAQVTESYYQQLFRPRHISLSPAFFYVKFKPWMLP